MFLIELPFALYVALNEDIDGTNSRQSMSSTAENSRKEGHVHSSP